MGYSTNMVIGAIGSKPGTRRYKYKEHQCGQNSEQQHSLDLSLLLLTMRFTLPVFKYYTPLRSLLCKSKIFLLPGGNWQHQRSQRGYIVIVPIRLIELIGPSCNHRNRHRNFSTEAHFFYFNIMS